VLVIDKEGYLVEGNPINRPVVAFNEAERILNGLVKQPPETWKYDSDNQNWMRGRVYKPDGTFITYDYFKIGGELTITHQFPDQDPKNVIA